ncbi:MAG: glycosyltransferase, partial [Candidatus Hodarchaeota archaeon]
VAIPSIWPEPLSRVLLETMSKGKPIVASNIGGPSEFIKDGENGILVDPGNTKQLTKAIINLLKNQHLQYKLSNHAQKILKNKYKNIVKNHISFYESFIKRNYIYEENKCK